MTPIKMTVMRRDGRKFFECQWRDPTTGKKKTQSTGAITKKDADRFAGKLLDKLENGTFQRKTKTTWSEFRERYELEVLPSRAEKTTLKIGVVFNTVERILSPGLLRSVDATQISRFQKTLREEGLAEPSIKGYLTYLASALRWAKRQGLITAVPEIEMPKRTATMKGRPITVEEFERMLVKIPAVTSPEAKDDADAVAKIVASWDRLLRGLWASGLRLGEALNLHWTDSRLLCVVNVDGELMLQINAAGQKSGKVTLTPIAPEFEAFLQETPEAEREGFVFNPLSKRPNGRIRRVDVVSSVIVEIGTKAGVKVTERNGKAKFASAHDLRRAFGSRWAQLVMPAVLQELMRHESISTTMSFYVGRNAKSASAAAREAYKKSVANTLANTPKSESEAGA